MLRNKADFTKRLNESYKPSILRIDNSNDKKAFEELIKAENLFIYDEMYDHLKELIKCRNPRVKLKDNDYKNLIEQHLAGRSINEYGAWVYYSWAARLVHILDEKEFIEVRTNRNKYKITDSEQALLATKTIGIVGLSVGQSIALTIAMERVCGHLRLADFDTAELSNLNRIRTGIHNLGLKKTIIAAREIAGIDPYLDVQIYNDGLTDTNINDFFTKDGKLDVLVEVCDGLDIKVISRFKAKEFGIPVVMDTNDRGMLDIERFDLEPSRPILHGLAGDLDPNNIKGLSNEDKVPYILRMIGAKSISMRLKASMMEVEQSINTWPQLASSVTLGGALTTDTCRKILLGQNHESGRYYVDFDEVIKNDQKENNLLPDKSLYDGPPELTIDVLRNIAGKYPAMDSPGSVTDHNIQAIVKAAAMAPSGGNAQPWKFLYNKGRLYICHDQHFSFSLLDYKNAGSYIGFGALLENIEITAASLGMKAIVDVFPVAEDKRLVAVVTFENDNSQSAYKYLAPAIPLRLTNRNVGDKKTLPENDKKDLISIAATIPGARLQLFEDDNTIASFAEILTNSERIRFLHPQGHYDTFVKELRFTAEEIKRTADGLDIDTLNMSVSDIAAMQIARDMAAIGFLHKLGKGEGFKKISRQSVMSASAIGVMSMDGHDAIHFLQGGRAIQRVWLEANSRNISLQPITQAIFMIERNIGNGSVDFNKYEQSEISKIHETLNKILNLEQNRYPVFIFRLFFGQQPKERALRRPLDKVLFVN